MNNDTISQLSMKEVFSLKIMDSDLPFFIFKRKQEGGLTIYYKARIKNQIKDLMLKAFRSGPS